MDQADQAKGEIAMSDQVDLCPVGGPLGAMAVAEERMGGTTEVAACIGASPTDRADVAGYGRRMYSGYRPKPHGQSDRPLPLG
jgi:hypothetical protein